MFATTVVDSITFSIAAAICLFGALGVVGFRNPVHNALSLVATLFGIAVLFIAQGAYFLAAIQVIVYAGAILAQTVCFSCLQCPGKDSEKKALNDSFKR